MFVLINRYCHLFVYLGSSGIQSCWVAFLTATTRDEKCHILRRCYGKFQEKSQNEKNCSLLKKSISLLLFYFYLHFYRFFLSRNKWLPIKPKITLTNVVFFLMRIQSLYNNWICRISWQENTFLKSFKAFVLFETNNEMLRHTRWYSI